MRHIRNQSGISLAEATVASMLVGITILVAFQTVSYSLNETSRGRGLLTRDRIIANLVNYAGMPAALRASIQPELADEPFNENLKRCAIEYHLLCYTKNAGAGYLPFRLYMPTVENSATPDTSGNYMMYTSGAITGVPTYPIRYSNFGHMCDTYTSTCPASDYPIEAFTEFLPYCMENISVAWKRYGGRTWNGPGYPAPGVPDHLNPLKHFPECRGARYVKVRLTVQPSDFENSGSSLNFKPYVATLYVDIVLVKSSRQ